MCVCCLYSRVKGHVYMYECRANACVFLLVAFEPVCVCVCVYNMFASHAVTVFAE